MVLDDGPPHQPDPLVEAAQPPLQLRPTATLGGQEVCGAGSRNHDLVFSQVDGDSLRPGTVTSAFEAT